MSAKTPGSNLARIAVYLAAAWLVVWAAMKLFVGSPQSLPELVRDASPFSPDVTFRVAIAIELSIFCLALLKPHLGWLPLSALYAFFVVLLVPMVAAGAESCGCGGGAIKMKPALMLSVDAALLVAVLVSRPWKKLRGPGLSAVVLSIGVAISWAAPWLVIRSADGSGAPVVVDSTTGAVTRDGQAVRYVQLEPAGWKGRAVHEIADLAPFIPAEMLPIEGAIVFWRQGCDVCATHLRKLATENDPTKQYLLVQVRDDLKSSRAVDAMPEGGNVTSHAFPANAEFAFTTPCDVIVRGGTVTDVLTGEQLVPH